MEKQFEVDVEKYTLESLRIIYDQSNKFLQDINGSIKETVNKSYVAIGVYGSISAKVILDYNAGIYEGILGKVLILLSTLPVLFILWNISPKKTSVNGLPPEHLTNPYFEYYKDLNQESIFYGGLIELLSKQIVMNSPVLDKVSLLLKISIYAELIFLLILVCCG